MSIMNIFSLPKRTHCYLEIPRKLKKDPAASDLVTSINNAFSTIEKDKGALKHFKVTVDAKPNKGIFNGINFQLWSDDTSSADMYVPTKEILEQRQSKGITAWVISAYQTLNGKNI